MLDREFTFKEEVFNFLTHGVGAVFGAVATIFLIILSMQQHDVWKITSAVIFGSSIFIMYSASTFYHCLSGPRIKNFFKILDHVTIYLLIAGSYTPFCLVTIRHDFGWPVFWMIWGLAFLGVIYKIFFIGKFPLLSLAFYLLMGWLIIIVIIPIYDHIAFAGFLWLIAGGLFYSAGTAFYASDGVNYMHGIWHLFVIAGTLCHFVAILFYVIL